VGGEGGHFATTIIAPTPPLIFPETRVVELMKGGDLFCKG